MNEPWLVPGEGGMGFGVALELARRETIKASGQHGPMASPHEGHSVILEELEELWEHVKADTGRSPEATKEAVQLATMALRYLADLCPVPEGFSWE